MTMKVVVLYTHPDDAEAFDTYYRDVHLPLAAQLPGLLRWEVARFAADAPYHQIAELFFPDQAALEAALASAEGKATADDYGKIAPAGSLLLISEVTAEG